MGTLSNHRYYRLPFLLLQLPVMMMVVVVVGVRVLMSRMEVPVRRPKGLRWLRIVCPLVMSVDVRRRY